MNIEHLVTYSSDETGHQAFCQGCRTRKRGTVQQVTDWGDRHEADARQVTRLGQLTALAVADSVKMLRETFCVAATAIGQFYLDTDDRKQEHIDRLQRLADECDRQRPLGPDGVHGDRHTTTCGCEDKLPTWDQMTDRDKHEALWHVWKREKDGTDYAVENYAAMYRDHPALVDLSAEESCDHAKAVIASIKTAYDRLGDAEYGRLMDLDPDVEG